MEYTLDQNAAKQADQLFAKIEEKGAYLGVLTRAEATTSKKGTKGVDLSFKTDTGATADYLTIWTHKADGAVINSGYNTLMAIMTCLEVRSLKAEPGEVEKYDPDQQKRVKVPAQLFKELMGKPIGLLIHMEEYEKMRDGFPTGETAWKPAISAPYDKDGFTASEIIGKAQKAETLAKMLATLRDRPLKNKPADTGSSNAPRTGGGFEDLGDDLPF